MKTIKPNRVLRVVFILILLLTLFVQSSAMAANEVITNTNDNTTLIECDSASAPAEETEIRYARDQYGRWWYRVWSLTRGIWLTDWILLG